ncbi:MAG TPA: hypothetical protein PLI21_01125, partial [Methanomassiliicoccaceae archaeon]|nr:hypothetical protein [Methanomassiliicoccaceae archaeon]
MWKVLGKEAVPVTVGYVWKERLEELSKRRKNSPRFRKLLEQADLRYYHDAIRDIHTFVLKFDPSTDMDELEFLKDYILKLHDLSDDPVVTFKDEPQRYTVI